MLCHMNSFETLHGTVSILMRRPNLAADVGKRGVNARPSALCLGPHKVHWCICQGTTGLARRPFPLAKHKAPSKAAVKLLLQLLPVYRLHCLEAGIGV